MKTKKTMIRQREENGDSNEFEPMNKRIKQTTSSSIERLLNGNEDIWKQIIQYIPLHKTKYILRMQLICEHIMDVVLSMDEFQCVWMKAFLNSHTPEYDTLPSLHFLQTSKYARSIISGIQSIRFRYLLSYGAENGQHYLEILKHCHWSVPQSTTGCAELDELVSDLKLLFTKLDLLAQEQCDEIDLIWKLMDKCKDYSHAGVEQAYSNRRSQKIESIADKCYRLIIDNKLKHQHRLVYLAAAGHAIHLNLYSEDFRYDDKTILFNHLPESLKRDHEIALKVVRTSGSALYVCLDETLKNDREIVLAVVQHDGAMFSHEIQSTELRSDKQIVIAAVKTYGCCYNKLGTELQNDKNVIRTALKYGGMWKAEVKLDPVLYSDDMSMMLAASRRYPDFIKNASERLLSDREFLLKLVARNRDALQYLPYNIRSDREIVTRAIQIYPESIWHASEELKQDRSLVLQCMKGSHSDLVLASLSEYWNDDYEMVLAAVTNNGSAMEDASERLRNDISIIEKAIESGEWYVIEYIPAKLAESREIVLKVIRKAPRYLAEVCGELKDDLELVITAARLLEDYILEDDFDELASDRIQKQVRSLMESDTEKSTMQALEELWIQQNK